MAVNCAPFVLYHCNTYACRMLFPPLRDVLPNSYRASLFILVSSEYNQGTFQTVSSKQILSSVHPGNSKPFFSSVNYFTDSHHLLKLLTCLSSSFNPKVSPAHFICSLKK